MISKNLFLYGNYRKLFVKIVGSGEIIYEYDKYQE